MSSFVDGKTYGALSRTGPVRRLGFVAVCTELLKTSNKTEGSIGDTTTELYTEFRSAAPNNVLMAATQACLFAPSVDGPTPKSSNNPAMSL